MSLSTRTLALKNSAEFSRSTSSSSFLLFFCCPSCAFWATQTTIEGGNWPSQVRGPWGQPQRQARQRTRLRIRETLAVPPAQRLAFPPTSMTKQSCVRIYLKTELQTRLAFALGASTTIAVLKRVGNLGTQRAGRAETTFATERACTVSYRPSAPSVEKIKKERKEA